MILCCYDKADSDICGDADEGKGTDMHDPIGASPSTKSSSEIYTPDILDASTSATEEVTSLEAATRLVEPMRMNNLTPEEITPRHLRKARREVRKARRGLLTIQHAAGRILTAARNEAQHGQQLARTNQTRRRTRRVQSAIRRASTLYAHYAALEDERARFARKVAAARDLVQAWEIDKVGLIKRRGGNGQVRALKQTTLHIARIERLCRDRLEETRRALAHVTVAEDAMRRDTDMVRMDPVNFARFAGRGRLGVRLGILGLLLALVALLYPPWSPPHLTLGCSNPAATSHNSACETVHAASSLRLINQGSGVLLGWVTVSVNSSSGASSQVIPLLLVPHGSRELSCGDYGGCAPQGDGTIKVQITSSGGSSAVAVVP